MLAAGLTGSAAVSTMFEGCDRSVRQGLLVSKGFLPAVPADFKALWITGFVTIIGWMIFRYARNKPTLKTGNLSGPSVVSQK